MFDIKAINFDKGNGLVPVIAQDNDTGRVLMLGYANEEALSISFITGYLTFFSRSKNRLWTKGEESGNFLKVMNMTPDCDNDTILAKVSPSGPVCHKGTDTCWGETNKETHLAFLQKLEGIITERKSRLNDENSYVARLFSLGINKIAQKVGEEAVELIIESKDTDDELFKGEAADLFFHYLILLHAKGFELSDIIEVLKKRHK
ncbi:MAG: bifunctional phosphoribosyl-AMP cyclohydrolase/phosphoribosyl-ATP diphosphatase HisIE [Saprospiraceae bacterium]|jgi:phosphoribosyl-ATP pyrophosphohydrolase/phosphoribosyl-AMP cyclohydrolase|nr:bifunctional phosphoribosyl-AMP cyclohydrolase/phosphoribosyl-ATP diphosphatase HisIE [Saprospiraceae bacterium]